MTEEFHLSFDSPEVEAAMLRLTLAKQELDAAFKELLRAATVKREQLPPVPAGQKGNVYHASFRSGDEGE